MKSRAKQEFEAWSGSYDRSLLHYFMFRPSYAAALEEIGRWYAEHQRPFRALDIGCGTGTLTGMLAASPWPVEAVGMDYSSGMCVQAAAKVERAGLSEAAHFVAGDSEHLPFADGVFDVVTCSNSFHHYPHQDVVVREMRRLLSPDGRLVLIDGFRDNAVGFVTFEVIIKRVEGAVYHATWQEIHRFFADAGFGSIRRRKINFWMPLLVTVGDV
jgi:ubiquinone/menaquinone biosynthesis C-methylase UbiE